jgi:hypothetical protein
LARIASVLHYEEGRVGPNPEVLHEGLIQDGERLVELIIDLERVGHMVVARADDRGGIGGDLIWRFVAVGEVVDPPWASEEDVSDLDGI